MHFVQDTEINGPRFNRNEIVKQTHVSTTNSSKIDFYSVLAHRQISVCFSLHPVMVNHLEIVLAQNMELKPYLISALSFLENIFDIISASITDIGETNPKNIYFSIYFNFVDNLFMRVCCMIFKYIFCILQCSFHL